MLGYTSYLNISWREKRSVSLWLHRRLPQRSRSPCLQKTPYGGWRLPRGFFHRNHRARTGAHASIAQSNKGIRNHPERRAKCYHEAKRANSKRARRNQTMQPTYPPLSIRYRRKKSPLISAKQALTPRYDQFPRCQCPHTPLRDGRSKEEKMEERA